MGRTYRSGAGGTRYGSGLWPVLLSLLVVVIPTACVLWFLNEAVQNERLAARQKLLEAYRGHLPLLRDRLDADWQRQGELLDAAAANIPAAAAFAVCVRQGLADSVTKPFSIRELLARAHAFLRRQQAAEPEKVQFGDCELDMAAHRLLKRGEEVPLTAKEFRLLAYFLQRPGRALTRKDILDAVWGRSVIVTGRSVDRCVTTLRAKIEPDPRRPLHIQTIRDIGYRFQTAEPDADRLC